ncbi:hypothetical protein CPT_Slocum_027 [Serratia phage Slocum]|nr:hypothetical protein CPT_Slocum_027 [Serratia phage Slocum]
MQIRQCLLENGLYVQIRHIRRKYRAAGAFRGKFEIIGGKLRSYQNNPYFGVVL